MRIQKIEVVGFKSFADRQVVILDDHITGVIGPNGCGKSNIVDAMRWCLGEQRAKHLRGSGMADVIFSGCATRGAAACAEVTVSFSNDGRVPVAYLNFSEIAITRRLFRDGSSEYLINGVLCRLRDISELLMGTGVGTKGYSIIEQGRVSDIVVSKPKDRRAMLDEAAGITKFKLQKNTAEKRIQQTQQNLDRVNDLLTELSGRLNSLKKAAKKAEQFLELREELRDADLWVSSHRYLGLLARYDIVHSQLGKEEGRLEELSEELEAKDTQINEQKAEVEILDQSCSEAQERVYELENRLQLAQQDQRFRQSSQDGHGERISKLQGELSESRSTHARVSEEQNAQQLSLDEMDAQARGESADQGVEGLDEAHSELAITLKSTQQSLGALQSKRNQQNTRVAELKAQLWSRSEAEQAERERLEQVRTDLAALQEAAAQEGDELSAAQARAEQGQDDLEGLRERRAEQESQREALRKGLREQRSALDSAQTKATQTRSRLESLQEIQGRYRGCDSGVQVLMQTANQSDSTLVIKGIAADYLEVPAQWDRALSAVLGDRLEGLVVPNAQHLRCGIELLQDKEEGRSAFFPLESMQSDGAAPEPLPSGCSLADQVQLHAEAPAALGRLLERVWCVQDLGEALELWSQAASQNYTLVTAQGEVLEASGVLVGGSANSLDSALLEQKREIQELARSLESQDSEAQHAQEALQESQAQLDELEFAQSELQERYLEAEKSSMQAKQELRRLQEEQSRREREQTRLESDLQALESGVEGKQEERAELEESLADLATSLPDLDSEIEELEERIETLQAQREGIAVQLTQAKVEQARRSEQRASILRALERSQLSLTQEQDRQSKIQEEIEAAQGQFQENEQAIETLSQEQEELKESLEENKENHQELQQQVSLAKEKVEKAESQVKQLRERRDGVHESVTKARSRLEDLKSKQGSLEQSVQDRHQVALLEVLLEFHDRPLADKACEQRVSNLRKRVQSLGDVNLTAIEEFREVQERFSYLSGQQSDLSGAIRQLQDAIDKINETTRKRFEETFHTVNEKFKSIFPRLFAGGKAELVLTEPDDILSTGVDIVAQPPGKRVSSLELMSGGEKALTAVSLIFGIFLIKPSPFCLLDEVDAPLDEANVGRFCDLVRELSQETQFIIITHNKRTMEAADRLYGVTMQQRGISKLVSVNMRRSLDKGRYSEASSSAAPSS